VKLVVTGASGFIGRNVLLHVPVDWPVIAVYHRTSDLPAFVAAHALHNVTAVACDLTDPKAVGELAARAGHCDAAIHLAANGDPAVSTERAAFDLQMNTVAVVNVLEQMTIGRMIYMSSGAVYDGLSGNVTPASAVNPHLPYAISKLASERYVAFFAGRGHTLSSYVNVRFFGAYGPYEAARKITTRWLRAMQNGEREFTIRGDGRNLIDFMYVDDTVDALLRLVREPSFSGTVDLASGAPVTIDEVAAAMSRAIGIPMTIRHEGAVPEYIEFRSADTALRDRFGFTPSVSFDDGIRRLHAFFNQPARA
jgi:nucleoside-diphosphate-sugar epimerase